MALQFSALLRNNRLDEIITDVGASGYLRIYDGVKPADCAAALSGNNLLAELGCNATFAPAATGGQLTLNSITQDSNANASGTASFFRIYKSDGTTCVIQGVVGTSGQDLNLNTVSIVAGAIVSVTSFVINEANA